jgi:hypothetical protein
MASQTYSLLALGERQDQVWVAEDRFPCWREPLAPVEAEGQRCLELAARNQLLSLAELGLRHDDDLTKTDSP